MSADQTREPLRPVLVASIVEISFLKNVYLGSFAPPCLQCHKSAHVDGRFLCFCTAKEVELLLNGGTAK